MWRIGKLKSLVFLSAREAFEGTESGTLGDESG